MCVYARACACVYQVPGGALGGLVLVNSAGSFLPDGVHVCVCVCVCVCVYVCVYLCIHLRMCACMYMKIQQRNKCFYSCRMECAILFFLVVHVQGRERARACILSLFVPMKVCKYVQYLSDSFFFHCCIF